MEEYTVIRWDTGWAQYKIGTARFLTEDEKEGYADWFKKLGMRPTGEWKELGFITATDLPNRQCDGCFAGCDNSAWIITSEEAEAYIELDKQREKKANEAAIEQEIKDLETIIARCEAQTDLPTREEARRQMTEYNNLMNEGGYGFIPHIYSKDEYEDAKKRLANLTK